MSEEIKQTEVVEETTQNQEINMKELLEEIKALRNELNASKQEIRNIKTRQAFEVKVENNKDKENLWGGLR